MNNVPSGTIDGTPFVQIDEAKVHEHLDGVVRRTVEETLNALLDAEADDLCGARRYERTEARLDTRAGHYQRKLHTKAGEVELRVPKLRQLPFETAIIERYRRRESSVEEALVEMYLAGVSVRRVERITEALWGTRVSPSTVTAGSIGKVVTEIQKILADKPESVKEDLEKNTKPEAWTKEGAELCKSAVYLNGDLLKPRGGVGADGVLQAPDG
jgi:Transposase, Mutator family